MSYLGLDIGTTGCKAAVFDQEGRMLALAYREYPLLSPQPGWAEVDSARVCEDCCSAIREAAAASRGDPVRGLGISCQGEAFTPVGGNGEFLANGMVSSDARAVDMVASFSREFGAERLYERTGHTPHPMFTVFKLLWLRQQRPDVFAQSPAVPVLRGPVPAAAGAGAGHQLAAGRADDAVQRAHAPVG